MAGNTSQPGATVVSRTVALLAAFDESHPRLTLTELARRAGLPLATAHRLTGELTSLGVLARGPSGEYVVGRRLWRIGLLAPMQTGLREVAADHVGLQVEHQRAQQSVLAADLLAAAVAPSRAPLSAMFVGF